MYTLINPNLWSRLVNWKLQEGLMFQCWVPSQTGGRSPPALQGVFILLKPSPDWMRPTQIVEGIYLFQSLPVWIWVISVKGSSQPSSRTAVDQTSGQAPQLARKIPQASWSLKTMTFLPRFEIDARLACSLHCYWEFFLTSDSASIASEIVNGGEMGKIPL